jgi:hypothetical protein
VVWTGHASISATDSVLLLQVKDNYPEIVSPPALGINAATYDRIRIRVRNNTASDDWYFKIYIQGGGERFADLVPTTMDTEFTEYTINLGTIPEWQGTIDRIGWLMARQVGTGTVEIDFIRLDLTDQPLSDDATLDALAVNEEPVDGFSPDEDTYEVILPPGSALLPEVSATASHPGAVVRITQAGEVDATALVEVVSQSGLFTTYYTIDFQLQVVARMPYFRTGFEEGMLPTGWPSSPPGYVATVENQVMKLTIDKVSPDDSFVLGDLNIRDFDLRPYMTIEYRSADTLDITVRISGSSGITSEGVSFTLPGSGEWIRYTFNLSASANEPWGFHLDSILLIFAPGKEDFDSEFSMNEIMIADSLNGKAFRIGVDQPAELVVDLGKDTVINPGEELLLDAGNPGADFTWNTGETTRTITVDTDGIYSVAVIGPNNCLAADSISVTVLTEVKTAPGNSINRLHIYPNPNNGRFYLEWDAPGDPDWLDITVSDMTGSTLHRIHTPNREHTIPVECELGTIPPGTYMVRVTTGNGITLRKVIVVR